MNTHRVPRIWTWRTYEAAAAPKMLKLPSSGVILRPRKPLHRQCSTCVPRGQIEPTGILKLCTTGMLDQDMDEPDAQN